jgi:hypothetical protein
MYDWRRLSSLSHFDSRSRRCGNVETRVLCGFPSSEGEQHRCGRGFIIPPSKRHFPSEAPVYRPFCRDCAVRAADGAEIVHIGKPRRMHDFTDSRSEPVSQIVKLAETEHSVRFDFEVLSIGYSSGGKFDLGRLFRFDVIRDLETGFTELIDA